MPISRRAFVLTGLSAAVGAALPVHVPSAHAAPLDPPAPTHMDGAGVRFHVISPTLVRLEYSESGQFEDRPTMLRPDGVAGVRSGEIRGDRVELDTGRIRLSYRRGSGPFGPGNLTVSVLVDGKWSAAAPQWEPQQYQPPLLGQGIAGYEGLATAPEHGGPRTSGNLGGWFRGLDSQQGPIALHDGLLSRDGWFFIDDSHSAVLAGDHFFRPVRRGRYQDGYLFGYGHDYPAALTDYRRLSGPAPLLPRKAFGVWFSRYFPYSQADYRQRLLPAFHAERVPLDVLMVDTDFKAPRKWNGWNWRPQLFPDPQGFLDWAHGLGLEVGMNVHPSIARSDPRFPQTERTAGPLPPVVMPNLISVQSDPAGLVDDNHGFDWSNPRQLGAYFDLHAPFERQGADFWWLDWCCEGAPAGPTDGAISGDGWITSRYTDRSRSRERRWPALARVGGSFQDWAGDRPGPWGQHRGAIHFTGDAHSTWEMLDFQTHFTVAEGNAGLPYVSHDIGGFQGTLTDELYARWVQLAAFQPILRLHSSDNGDIRRLPWEFAEPARGVAAEFLRLHSLEHEGGAYARTSLRWSDAERRLIVGAPVGGYAAQVPRRRYDVEVVGSGGAPSVGSSRVDLDPFWTRPANRG